MGITVLLSVKYNFLYQHSRECLQTQANQTRTAASRVTAKNRQAHFSYLAKRRMRFEFEEQALY